MSDKGELFGYKVGIEHWRPFAQAPKDGSTIRVMRKSHKVERARFAVGYWWVVSRWMPISVSLLNESGNDPVTHFTEGDESA